MRRALLALAVVVLTLAANRAALPRLAALAQDATLVPPDDPTVVLDREITEEFGFAHPVVWVLEARDGTVWTPRLLERLAALTDDVRRIPGVIALDVIGLASPNMRDLRVTEEGLEPTYLMGDVPRSPAAVAALRRRIETDPNYAGTLVSGDGRAAMVVANFTDDADLHAVGTAALALRDRYRDAETAAWVAGAPVLGVVAPSALGGVAARAAVCALAGLAVFCLLLGVRAATAALFAAVVAASWIAVGTAFTHAALPWALEAAVPTCFVAAAVGTGVGRPGVLAAILGASMASGAFVAAPPSRALWIAAAAGALVGVAAGGVARVVFNPTLSPPAGGGGARLVAVVLAVAALLGVPRLRCSLDLLGYGERYLPRSAAADLLAVRRLFSPPLSFAVRARGEPGFVRAPEVLHALDATAVAARADPAVRSAMSIADVVKMVHRAFNDERPESFAIPDDPALVGRYLALAYMPAFRRFLDRAFADTALWVQVASERPADLERVLRRIRRALAERPPPGAELDPPAGDGAVLLVMARVARRVAVSAGLALLIAGGAAAAAARRRAAVTAVSAGVLAAAVGTGVLGWAGHAVDLVSLPLLAGVTVATAALGGSGPPSARFALGLAGTGAVALLAPLPAAALVAALLLGPGLALLVVSPPTTTAGAPPCGKLSPPRL